MDKKCFYTVPISKGRVFKRVYLCFSLLSSQVWEKSDDVQLITISGGGSKRKIFSAGGDIKSKSNRTKKEEPWLKVIPCRYSWTSFKRRAKCN